jgi:hypothetical protein
MKYDKKTELTNLLKKYVVDNEINLSEFRVQHPKEYSLIPHYFGSIREALRVNGWVKINRVCRDGILMPTLKDQLAFYALNELHKEHTFDSIGHKFGGTTRMCVRQLYTVLKKNIESANKNMETSKNTDTSMNTNIDTSTNTNISAAK